MAETHGQLTEEERQEAAEHSPPKAKVVHATVSGQGYDELRRPASSLFWSAVAAGIAIMASVSVGGALHHALPDVPGRDAVVAWGYPIGFLIVVLGRMQLFTEQTVVAILPLASDRSWSNFRRVARLWTIVFAGNMIGALAVSALVIFGRVQSSEVLDGMLALSSKLLDRSAAETLMQAIPAGFIMASVAWIRSAEDQFGFWIVLVLTYAIGLCGFAHVIAGAAEVFLLLWSGKADAAWVGLGFLLPALIGNIIGGTGLFAVLAHAQVRREI